MYRHTKDELIISTRAAPKTPSVAALMPIMAVVLIAFLVIGIALPVLPLHVHQGLGFGAFIVGLVTGSQFGASLLSRVSAGRYADKRGPKRAVVIGLLTAIAAGLLYIVSLHFGDAPTVSVTILLLGRALLGRAESFIITGAVSWGLALVGAKNAGRVIAWMGMAMFAALALGAPLGTTLYSAGGFAGVAVAATLMPLVTVLLVALLSPVPTADGGRPAFKTVAAAVWLPGSGAAGLALIGLAPGRGTAAVGAALARFGYSLVYPGIGVEAVVRAPPQSRGVAMGAYTVFLDVALGFGSPALGLVAGRFGLDAAFLVSALIALGAAVIALRLLFTHCFDRRQPCLTSS